MPGAGTIRTGTMRFKIPCISFKRDGSPVVYRFVIEGYSTFESDGLNEDKDAITFRMSEHFTRYWCELA